MSPQWTYNQWLDHYYDPDHFYRLFPDYANLVRQEKSEVGLSTSQANQKEAIETIIASRMNL